MSPIPNTAPFPEAEIELLNRIVSNATATQRAWLAGFLAGLDSASTAPKNIAQPRTTEPLSIIYASESGNCERLAAEAAKAARKRGFKPTIIDMADLDVATLADMRHLIVIAATWGEGEPPSRAAASYSQLMSETAPRLDNVEYGVLALGDTAYTEFCAVGRAIDERLSALGAKRIADRVDCDLDFSETATRWITDTLTTLAPKEESHGQVIAVDFGTHSIDEPTLGPFEAEVNEHIDLNSSYSDKETIHLELGFDDKAPGYNPGDSLDLYPQNDPELVDEILRAIHFDANDALRNELIEIHDISTLSVKTIENFVAQTGHKEAKELLDSGAAREWISGRQLIDLLDAFSVTLSMESLRAITRPLAPRAYSIASSRREVGNEAHLLISAVRYQNQGRSRKGVASTYAADRLKKGQQVRVKLRPNKHFGLPSSERDIIMVGPGTGVAPFRGFIQERRATGASGRSWLFFGDRNYLHDFLYQLEWQDALKDGVLTRMDVAFSRDTPQKVYVQNKLWEHRRNLIEWLEGGAHFYVCGDAKTMAKDVRSMLVRAYQDVKQISPDAAEQTVRNIERERRYLQDVY